MDNTFFNSIELLRLVAKWKKHLIIVGILSLAGSIIFSSPHFIKPKYKSFALIYPSNLIAYSTESPTEQMLQLAQSYDIRDKIITSFNLYKHYDLDTTKVKSYLSKIYQMYEENITIKKTEYESMEITVFDTDPLIASSIADSIIHYFDVKARALQVEKSYEVMLIASEQLEKKKYEMDSMQNILHEYSMKYGLLDIKQQTREVMRSIMRSGASGSGKSYSEGKSLFDNLKEKGNEFTSLTEHLWRVRGSYNDIKLVYENANRDVYKKLTYSNVVTKPFPSDKKAYPVRWLIVVISVGVSLLLSFIVLLIFNTGKK